MRAAGLMPALLLLLFGCAAEELPHASARQPARREVVAIPLADGTTSIGWFQCHRGYPLAAR